MNYLESEAVEAKPNPPKPNDRCRAAENRAATTRRTRRDSRVQVYMLSEYADEYP